MKEVMNLLEATKLLPIGDIGSFIHVYHPSGCIHYPIGSRSIAIGGKESPLALLGEDGIKLGDTFFRNKDYFTKTTSLLQEYKHFDLDLILGDRDFGTHRKFPGTVSLNHTGICINVSERDAMIDRIVEGYRASIHKVYEDPAGREEDMRWLFIGDARSINPMFEVVLPNPKLKVKNHFQIDVDTSVSQEVLEQHFSAQFGNIPFFDWKLDISGVGTVLQMGTLRTLQGYDIRLGVGNTTRDTMAHRQSMEEIS